MFPSDRKTDYRPQLRHFVVSVEGGVTEREYFTRLRKLFWDRCNITILGKKTESAPSDVIMHANAFRGHLVEGDEIWCVCDRDRWTEEQMRELSEWSESGDCKFVAISNPKFELWLVAHFRDLPRERFGCVEALKAYIPDYDKHLKDALITSESVSRAISRAKVITPTSKPPINEYGTNVWVLVEKMSFRPLSEIERLNAEAAGTEEEGAGEIVQPEFTGIVNAVSSSKVE